MTFEEEPEWMRKARQVPMYSTWESRQPPEPKQDHQPKKEKYAQAQ